MRNVFRPQVLSHLAWMAAGAVIAAGGFMAHAYVPNDDPLPRVIAYRGTLDHNGAPVNGTRTMTFRLFAAASGGSALWTETVNAVALSQGQFSVNLGTTTALGSAVLGQTTLWLEVVIQDPVAGDVVLPTRQRLFANPYALRAAEAQMFRVRQNLSVDGNAAVQGSVQVDGAVNAGSVAATGTVSAASVNATTVSAEGNLRSNTGQLVVPRVPAFFAYNDFGGDRDTTGLFPGNRVKFNNGNHYSVTTFQFTAPVAGYYQFNWTAFTNNNAGRAFLLKNGTAFVHGEGAGKTVAALVELNAGDTVAISGTPGAPLRWFGADNHNGFSGILVAAR